MSLKDWLANAWLTEHQPSPEETADLLAVIDRDLRECRLPGLGPDWRMAIAYNAALQAAVAALAAAGFRVTREAHHFRAIQSLTFTLGCNAARIAQIDAVRKKRNISDYERAGLVSDREADEMVELAEDLRATLTAWLKEAHPHLLLPGAP